MFFSTSSFRAQNDTQDHEAYLEQKLIPFSSHPIHPSTVHFPIAFLTGSNILNLLYGACLYTPALVPFAVDKENTGTIAILGYFLNLTGIVTSIPAVLTGFAELYAMIQGRGLMVYDKKLDCKVIEPVVKTTLTHVCISLPLLVHLLLCFQSPIAAATNNSIGYLERYRSWSGSLQLDHGT